jgi:hypothetical protein
MLFSNLLHHRSGQSRRPAHRPHKRSFVPRLEMFEDRTVPSILTVLNNLDSGAGSLRDTIKHASGADTIMFASSLNGQTITLTSDELDISKSLDIEGPGAGLLAISGNNHSRVFHISQNEKPVAVTIAGLTIEDGQSSGSTGGGILNVSSTLTLINDVLSNNVAIGRTTVDRAAEGGAISNQNGATVTVSGCEFWGNQALGKDYGNAFGGAIYNLNSAATVTNSRFTNNLAQGGAGGNSPIGTINSGFALGGGVVNDVNATLTISGCTFTANEAQGGSNIAGQPTGRNVGTGSGGGLFDAGVATVTNCTFTDNKAAGGNGNTGGSTVVRIGDGIGGGLGTVVAFTYAQSLTVTGCTFTHNEAVGGTGNTGGVITGDGIGGGLAVFFGASVTLTNSTFCGNQAVGSDGGAGQSGGDGLGGGIANFAGSSLTVSSCTFSGNQATGGAGGAGANGGNAFGGGVYNDGQSTLTVTSSTISTNQATGGAAGNGGSAGQGIGGGAYFASGGTVCLDASTVANIFGNNASTSDKDIFGVYEIC